MMDIHIFDIDHTLIKKSTTQCFIRTGLKNRMVSVSQILRFPVQWALYKLAIIEPEFIEKEIRKYRDIPITRLEKLSLESFEKHGRKQLYSEGIELLDKLKQSGKKVIAATSSVDFLIKPFMEFLGIEEYIATKLELSQGKTTGRTEGNAVFGKNKLEAVRKYLQEKQIPLEKAAFYSDSFNDLPLLEACGRPVAVNPDRRLKKEAEKRGWNCLFFSRTLGK